MRLDPDTLDTIKLDRAFVEPITDDPFQAQIAASVIDLAHRRAMNAVNFAARVRRDREPAP